MDGANTGTCCAECSDQACRSVQSTADRGAAVSSGSEINYQLRQDLSNGIGRSLVNPVTAVATHIDACLRLLDESRWQGSPEQRLSKLRNLLRDAATDAAQTVELMQHWTSSRRLQPGSKSLGRPTVILNDCVSTTQHRFSTNQHVIQTNLQSKQVVFFDQFNCFSLVRDILNKCSELPKECSGVTSIECTDTVSDLVSNVVIRIRLVVQPAEFSSRVVSEQYGDAETQPAAWVISDIFNAGELEHMGKRVSEIGGCIYRALATDNEFDFGFSLIPHILGGKG